MATTPLPPHDLADVPPMPAPVAGAVLVPSSVQRCRKCGVLRVALYGLGGIELWLGFAKDGKAPAWSPDRPPCP